MTKLLLVTDWWPFGNQFQKGGSPIGDQKNRPSLTLPLCVGLNRGSMWQLRPVQLFSSLLPIPGHTGEVNFRNLDRRGPS